MKTSLVRVLAVSALIVAVSAGCSSGGSISSGATTTTPPGGSTVDTLAPPTVVNTKTATVDAIDNDYRPKNLQIHVGTKVTFVNAGRNVHDVVPDDPKAANFGVSQDHFNPGEKTSFTFTKPGTYTYYCSLHATATAGSMRGVITVTK